MNKDDQPRQSSSADLHRQKLTEIRILLPAELSTAWQRCSWALVQEKGQSRLESMEEMVRDFLVKHGC